MPTASQLGDWNSAVDFAGPTTPSLAAQVAYAWQLAFGRPITAEEFSLVKPFLQQRIDDLGRGFHADPARRSDGRSFPATVQCQRVFVCRLEFSSA